jgi:macrolide-specific efflux system membrane fusion protein
VSKTVKVILGVVIAIAVVAATITVFALQPQENVSDSVLTEVIERRDVTTTVAASGVVEAADQRSVSFRQAGEVASIEVNVGDVVSEGDVLATLDPRDLEAALAQARSALEGARGGITAAAQTEASAQAGINLADERLTIAEQGVRAARGGSRDERDKANRALASRQADRDAAELTMQVAREGRVQADLALRAAQATFEQAEKALEDATLVAPIAGTVISIDSKVGELVGQTSLASGASTGFLVLADLSTFLVKADFAEADVVGIEEGQEVNVTFDAIPGGGVTGRVIEAGLFGGVDPAGGRLTTYEVTISIPTPPQGLRVGMTAQASITTESRSDVLAAPVTALVESEGETFVQVLGADGTISLVEVTVGIQGGYWVEITSGLTGGERVVTGASGDIPVVGGGGFGPPEGTPGGDSE